MTHETLLDGLKICAGVCAACLVFGVLIYWLDWFGAAISAACGVALVHRIERMGGR